MISYTGSTLRSCCFRLPRRDRVRAALLLVVVAAQAPLDVAGQLLAPLVLLADVRVGPLLSASPCVDEGPGHVPGR